MIFNSKTSIPATRPVLTLTGLSLLLLLAGCSKPLAWPSSPLYDFEQRGKAAWTEGDREAVMEAIQGHYAHFDVVAYEDTTTRTTMRTFIVSYGFTDIYLEDGKLMQSDYFVHGQQKLSRKNARSWFSDKMIQAIKPRSSEVDLFYRDGRWQLYRQPSPSLLGIEGDPDQPLSRDPNDPKLTDPDQDGKPGATVHLEVGSFFKGEIYVIRREIYSNYFGLNADGSISGYVKDASEQYVVGASKKILEQESNNFQHPDMGLSPILLVKVDPAIDTWEELEEIRDEIFPAEPTFYH